jgi:hypothetical protein
MREYSFEITKKMYDYLLPVFGITAKNKLICRTDRKVEKYYFIGTKEDHIDLLTRCRYI